jgi:flagellar hook-associated protein 1 FlgK
VANIFFGLNIGRSALLSHQAALEVTGHNLANVQTEGYSRQRVELVQAQPINTPVGSVGAGVNAARIERLQLGYLERQISRVTVENGYDTALTQGLDELQTLLGEPSADGISAALTEFWNSWDDLATSPADAAFRGQVIDRANHLSAVYNQRIQGFLAVEDRFNEGLADAMADVNALATELADFNGSIAKSEASGYPANDLRDQRDGVIRQIAEKLGVESEEEESYVNLRMANGGPYLVNRQETYELKAGVDSRSHLSGFRVESSPVTPSGGEMGALLELRGEVSPGLRDELSQWMATVADRVNNLHAAGVDRDGVGGRNLFAWKGEPTEVTVAPSDGFAGIAFDENLEPGTHHLEVVAVDALAPNALGNLSTGAINLSASGTYAGPDVLNLDYHVRIISANADPASLDGLRVQLFRGGEPAGEMQSVSGAVATTVSWTDVDGMQFDANIAAGASYVVSERSDGIVTTGRVRLDGGPDVAVDLATGNNISFTGGNERGFLAGGGATVNFSGASFAGASFTVYGSSARLSVDTVVAADTDRVAAARAPEPGAAPALGDGETARQIADLATQAIFETIDETAAGFLSKTVQALGAKGRDSAVFEEASASVLLQLEAQRASVSGVNMDEEMVQLLQYQRGFEAAARFLTTVDGMIETLINRVGLAGR